MTRVKQDRNRCQGNPWRVISMNQADEDKRSDHGEHRHPDTAAEKADSRPHGGPTNRAHNQRIRLGDWRVWQQHQDCQRGPERGHQKHADPVRLQDRQHSEHTRYP